MAGEKAKNILEKEYIARLQQLGRAIEGNRKLTYALQYHVNTRGNPMIFHDKPYLIPIYKDTAQEIVMQSSVQTGKSEFLIISSLEGSERGLQVLYVLPTTDIRNLFVANRIDKTLHASSFYRSKLHPTNMTNDGRSDSRGLKHFGKGAIFFAGSNSRNTFIEKPIDMVVADEIDRFDQTNYALADDRMTASPHKIKLEASNPTVENYGINRRFQKSNQSEWLVKCDHCNQWQEMDWFKNVIRQTDEDVYILRDNLWSPDLDRDIHVYCVKCEDPIYRHTHRAAWVAKYPAIKNTHGYHIHQILSPYVRIEKMWGKFKDGLESDTEMQVFWNSMLGKPYAGLGSKITDTMLNACKRDYLMPQQSQQCIVGVDVGKVLHVVIRELLPGEELRLVFAGTVRHFEDLDHLFSRYYVSCLVIDAMPEMRKSIELTKKYPGRAWICRYHPRFKELQKNDKDMSITVDRTLAMDRVFSWFNQQRLTLPKNAQSLDKEEYFRQLKMPTRVLNSDKDRYEWLGDPDHYFHAEAYIQVAYMARGTFHVSSLAMGQEARDFRTAADIPKEFPKQNFPPGTPQQVIDHYKRIYEQAKAADTMNPSKGSTDGR